MKVVAGGEKLVKALKDRGYQFFKKSPTNQQFVILDDAKIKELRKNISFCFWEKYYERHSVVRFATSWSTKAEDIEALKELL